MDRKIQLLNNPALHLGKSVFRGRLGAENYIDMGLPSGTKWAASNLDVTTESKLAASPFQYECSFFSWGNIPGYNPIDEHTFEHDFGNANQEEPWYEGQPYGDTPGNTLTGDIPTNREYDAARALLGDPWRIPLEADFEELIANSIYIDATGNEISAETSDKRVTVNGILGIYLQSKINDNRLFFPSSGYSQGTTWIGRGDSGYYWSASFRTSRWALNLAFYSGRVNPMDFGSRYSGHAIRAVMN